ncbi:MAG: DUF5667 domain-containing protein [Symbiobacteriia bacterium]
MTIKKVAAAAVVAALLAGASVTALADTTQSAPPPTAGTTATGSTAGVLPGSPLYFFDRLFESLQLFLTRDPGARVNLYVNFADERLSELKLVTSQKGNTPNQQTAARQLVTDVVKNLSSADTGLETVKLANGSVGTTATQVQQAATQTQVVVHQTSDLPAALIPQILQSLNQIAQEADALSQVKVEAVMQAKSAGARPGRLALTVKMAQNAGKSLTTVAPLLNTQTPTQVAQQLGLDPNTFMKLAVQVSGNGIKVSATGTGTVSATTATAPTAAAADWNNQIALPGGVTKVLDYKYEAEGTNVEYQVTYINGSGNLANYKYESKDGKVEAKLTMAGQRPGNSSHLLVNISSNGNGKGHEKEKEKDKEHEHEHEHDFEED